MTRKDYVKLAEIVRVAKTRQQRHEDMNPVEAIKFFETELADLCARDNPRFDRRRFELACAMEGKKND